jgi:hypothetical protein
MRQLGHTDPTLTLRIYAQQMSRRVGERERLRTLVEGGDSGRNLDGAPIFAAEADSPAMVDGLKVCD